MTKWVRDVLRLLGPDWKFAGHTGQSHVRFRHASGVVLITARDFGDPRALLNIRATARRAVLQ